MLKMNHFLRQIIASTSFIRGISSVTKISLSSRCSTIAINQRLLVSPVSTSHLLIARYKSKGKGKHKQQQTASDSQADEDDFDGEVVDKHTKVMKINVTSLRVDAILKNGLGIARNKIETMFYESKIRVNGEKIPKKSVSVKEGDEIDIIKGQQQNNPNFLVVARVEILGAQANEDSITLKIRRSKSLVVENYTDKWQGT